MPLYEYRCETCGEQEEKLEGFSAPTEHACEHCGAAAGMRRQISVTAFTLAGGGWHAQGYSGPPSAKKEGAAEAPAATPATPPAASGGCAGGCGCHAAKPAN
jgi:putative FmdB family regulatory protein